MNEETLNKIIMWISGFLIGMSVGILIGAGQ